MVITKAHVILVGLLVVASFLIGTLYTKVQYLEKGGAPVAGGQPSAPSKYKSFNDAFKALAKDAKLDGDKLVTCMNSGDKKPAVDAEVAQGVAVGVDGTPAFFINGIIIPGAVPIDQFKQVIDKELAGTTDKAMKRSTIDLGDAPSQGTKGAPITMVEFSDFQCPFCERAYPTVKQLMKDYEGKIYLVYKQYPLVSIHPHAEKAAEAALCAKDQGKFWEFHDKMFENQNDWVNQPV